jgi:phosphate ABC transporter phosphate-binding protein
MNSITYDLADQIAARLLSAVRGGASGPASTVASATGPHVSLHAAGATFAAPLYLKWFEASGEAVSYDAIGSEAGIQQLAAGKVDFAASDMPLSAEGTSSPSRVTQFATVLGGVVPIYNLPGVRRELDLTPEVLAGIYSGTIRKWNDPHILATNHGVHLPNADIVVTHRSDGSGTTFVWTSYLSQVSPEWKASVGAGPHVTWPTGTGAKGNEGVAELVQKTSYAIGYVELTYAIQHGLTYAAVKNSAGRFIKADLDSITTAAAGAATTTGPDSQISILNAPGKTAYPISTFTWVLVPVEGLDPQKRAAIADLLNWMLTSGQKQCASLGYAPLPHEVVARELQALTVLK